MFSSYLLYSISHPNKHGEPILDLTSYKDTSADNPLNLSDYELKFYCVCKKLLSDYGLRCPVTEDVCHKLKCRLWHMGQRLCGVGSTKRNKILQEWKCPGANWELCIDCVKVNDNLHMQLCKKEAN